MNDCLETGPPLQNLICFAVCRFGTFSNQLPCVETLLSRPSLRCGLEKQIVTHFDFIGSAIKSHNKLKLRLMRALFGLVQTLVLLAVTLK